MSLHTAQVSTDSRWVRYFEHVPRACFIGQTCQCRLKAATDSATDETRCGRRQGRRRQDSSWSGRLRAGPRLHWSRTTLQRRVPALLPVGAQARSKLGSGARSWSSRASPDPSRSEQEAHNRPVCLMVNRQQFGRHRLRPAQRLFPSRRVEREALPPHIKSLTFDHNGSHFSSTKITFPPDPPVFSPISVNTALTKKSTYPSTLGVPKTPRFMTYP